MDVQKNGAVGDDGNRLTPNDPSPDDIPSTDDPSLTELDKTIDDSFPASDPPSLP